MALEPPSTDDVEIRRVRHALSLSEPRLAVEKVQSGRRLESFVVAMVV